MHQRGHDGLRIKPPFGANASHGNWMGDVGLAAGASLAQMRLVSELVGLSHALDVGFGEVIQAACQGVERRSFGLRRRSRRAAQTVPTRQATEGGRQASNGK